MRHGKKFNHLSRKRGHRKAMLSNMACSLIEHKRINTTVAKAKALKVYLEPLITKSKDDTTHSRRSAFRYLKDKAAVNELYREIAPKVANRPGGYTRIIRLGNRLGDNAEMCMIELVDFNELLLSTDGDTKKTRRSRRGRGKGSSNSAKSQSTDTSAESKSTEEPAADAKTTSDKKEEADAKAPKSESSSKEEAPKAEKKESPKKDETPKAEKKEEAPKTEKKESKDDDSKDKKEEK